MKKTENIAAACFILIELLIQILGFAAYQDTPGFFWDLANCILIMAPLLFGLRIGLICLLPMAVSEIIWFLQISAVGPLLHAVSFAAVVCLFGIIGGGLSKAYLPKRILWTVVCYEAGLLAEEILYYFLRCAFLANRMNWADAAGTFLSWANPVLLAVGTGWLVIRRRGRRNNSMRSGHECR